MSFYGMSILHMTALLTSVSVMGFLVCYCLGRRAKAPWLLGGFLILALGGSLALWLFSEPVMLDQAAGNARLYSELYNRLGRDLATNDDYLQAVKRAHRAWAIQVLLLVVLPMVIGLGLPWYERYTREDRVSAASLAEAEPGARGRDGEQIT